MLESNEHAFVVKSGITPSSALSMRMMLEGLRLSFCGCFGLPPSPQQEREHVAQNDTEDELLKRLPDKGPLDGKATRSLSLSGSHALKKTALDEKSVREGVATLLHVKAVAAAGCEARPHHHRTSSSGMTTTTTTTACSTGSTPLATLGSSTHLPISRASTGGDTTHHSRLSPFGRRSSASHHAPTSPDPSLLGAPCCTSTPPSPLGPARHHQQQQQDSSQHRGSSSPLHSLQLHHKHSSPSSTADKQLRGSDSPGKGPCPDVAARKVSFDVAANYGLLRPSSLPNVAPHATHQQQAGRDATLGSTKSVVPHHLSFPASVEELERAAEEVVVSLTGSHLVAAAGVGGGGCGAQQQEGKRQQQQQRDADEAAALTGFFAPKKSPRHNNILHK